MKNNIETIKMLIAFYEDHMKDTYDSELDYYKDHEDIILLQRSIEELTTVKTIS